MKHLTVKSGRQTYKISIDRILYLEADHVYTKFHTVDGEIVHARQDLSSTVRELPADRFVRIHRSYVINLDFVGEWTRSYVRIGKVRIPISRHRLAKIKDKFRAMTWS